jgi:polyhydroxyalkanoate synthase
MPPLQAAVRALVLVATTGASTIAAAAVERVPHLTRTEDGATLGLHRFPGDGPPILLVHGLSSNHRSFDLAGRGLAWDLHGAGHDVWMLDLRGREDSKPPPGPPRWTLDDYGRYDIAAAIEYIRTSTGHDKVAYVGHSMGGMVLAVYHHWHGGDALGPAVVLASPITFDHPDPLLIASARSMRSSSLVPRVPSPAAARVASVLPQTPRVDALLFDRDGTTAATRKAMYRDIVSPMTAGELGHISRIIDSGRLRSADDTIDYVDSLANWTTPLLVVAGRTDRVASPDRVVAWIDAAESADETWWVAGSVRGYPHEFGHLDLILADDVQQTLHADILAWLAERSW